MCHKHFVHLTFFFISSILMLAWFNPTTGTFIGHQAVEEASVYKCIDKERHALLHFKSYIHQDPEGFLSTWTPEDEETNDCCKWSGVMCDNQRGHVTNLYLGYGRLEGEISHSLLNLSYLNSLDLSYNYFNGTIPIFIASMSQLRYLNLDSNNFSGTIPPELGNLSNLLELSLRHLNKCTIESLDWLSHLPQLEVLSMDGISLAKADKWVNMILSLQKLSYLSLGRCDLSQVMHPYSSSFNSSSSSIVALSLVENNLNSSMYLWLFPMISDRLERLHLYGNKLEFIPKELGNLCSLTSLYIYNNSLAVKFPELLNNLSGCTYMTLEEFDASGNQLTGSLPDDIQKFSSLQLLYLSNNQLNGTISENVWQLPQLNILDVSSNSLKGVISKIIGKTNIVTIYLSNNSLEGVPSEVQMSNLSGVEELDLSSCKLGPHFPNWIQSLKNITFLNIANSRISDIVPVEFWNSWPSQLTYLNLSYNNISGHIPNVSSSLQCLDLSKNKFYGAISFLCQIVEGALSFLDLSNNLFTGQIPDCLWHFKKLHVLNLGHNNLFGSLSPSINNLINLEVFYLYNNNFSGELPSSLKNCTNLTFLDLGANKFSGYVPTWIGEKLSGLYALSLTSNNFFGTIPLQLCQLVNLQILDLSMNNLYGTIPSCLNNLTTMVQDRLSPKQNEHYFDWGFFFIHKREYIDHAMIMWQGSIREFSSTLGLVKSIDLSSNNLTGQVPSELVDLHELIELNLSMNSLLGEIPTKIGQMKELQILDLSRNKFSGRIPSSMSNMTLLNYLDVSYNDLSGRIPLSTQLQSFEPSRYTENPGLCGPPLKKLCPEDKEPQVPTHVDRSEGKDGGEGIDDLQILFYIGACIGFVTGFWIACGALIINHRGRNAFFKFLDKLKD